MNDEMRSHSEIKFGLGNGTTVRLYFVSVARIEDTLKELKKLRDDRIRTIV